MKLLIEIDEKTYNDVQNGKIYSSSRDVPQESVLAIKNGVSIPDNATNGDVIKAMFPGLEIEYADIDEYTNKPRYVKLIVGDTIITRMSVDRWNAPYKGE